VLADAGIDVVAQVGDAEALLATLDATAVDIAVVDIRMPPTRTTEGIVAAATIRRIAAGGWVIDPLVVSRLVGRRRERNPLDELTDREREVLGLMAEGRSNQAISERMFLSPKTVETHIRSVFSKLGLDDLPGDNRRVLSVLAYLRR